jgi:hypothetical protein
MAAAPVMRAADPPLRSFYVVRGHGSDAGNSYADILDVAPLGEDVRVRWIRMSYSNEPCQGNLVDAEERIVRHTTVAALAGSDLCIGQRRLNEAIEPFSEPWRGTSFEWGTTTVVAICRGRESVLSMPENKIIDYEALRRRDSLVVAVSDVFNHVKNTVFGGEVNFWESTPEQSRRREALGLAVIPEIESGRYRAVIHLRATNELTIDAAKRHLELKPEAELLERASLRFESYRPANIPAIGVSARVFGDVRLKLAVDRETGRVTDVTVLSGVPLLSIGAAETAGSWRFTPDSLTSDRIDVTLRFQKRASSARRLVWRSRLPTPDFF